MSDKHKEPWERMRGESAIAYQRFVEYRDLGPNRSLSRVVRNAGAKSHYKTQLSRWSSKFDWVKRCDAYDDHLDEERRKTHAARVRRMARKHQHVHDRIFSLVERVLDRYESAWEDDDLDEISLQHLARITEVGQKLGRLATGQPTERKDVRAVLGTSERPFEEMSDAELIALEAALQEIVDE